MHASTRRWLVPLLVLGTSSVARAAAPASAAQLRVRAFIIRAEDERDPNGPELVPALSNPSGDLRARAVRALGRIGDPASVTIVARGLTDRDIDVQHEAAFALGEIEDPSAFESLAHAAQAKETELRVLASEALSKIKWPTEQARTAAGNVVAHQYLGALDGFQEGDPKILARVLRFVWRFGGGTEDLTESLTRLSADSDPSISEAATYAAARLGDARMIPALELALHDARPVMRALGCKGLGRLAHDAKAAGKDPEPGERGRLMELSKDADPNVRVEALRALASFPPPGEEAALALVRDRLREADSGVQRLAEELAGAWKLQAAAPLLAGALDSDRLDLIPEIAAALASIRQAAAVPDLERLAAKQDWRLRAAAAEALATKPLGEDAAVRGLQDKLLRDKDPRVVAAAVGAAGTSGRKDAAAVALAHLGDADVVVRATAAALLPDLVAAGLGKADAVVALRRAYDAAGRERQADARIAIIETLSTLLGEASRPDLERAFRDADYTVRIRARQLWLGLPNRPAARPDIGAAGTWHPIQFYLDAAAEETDPTPRVLRFVTTQGPIDVDLFPADAVLTVRNMEQLAANGYFDGLSFHRVVPDFVAQGGCPRGDGNGGPGWSIRCEINQRRYVRGAVGMALSGKDTGGSQFFFTLSPQPHLDGGYTVFGQVRPDSFAVMDRIRRYDSIVSAKVTVGRVPEAPAPPRKPVATEALADAPKK